jgi:uncharacterized protein YkwD
MTWAVDCLVDQERLRHGLPVLQVSMKLSKAAQGWTDTMEAKHIFEHGSDRAFSKRLLAVGYDWAMGGENIATGFATPRDAVSAWMASPGHCQNVLNPGFRAMGAGMDLPPIAGFAAEPATWTQDFGILRGQSQPSQDYRPSEGCPYAIPASSGHGSSS